MALANVAWILASRGKRVLAVDWDLEAPGLHRYFHPFLDDKDLTASEGIIDFVRKFESAALTPSADATASSRDWYVPLADLKKYAVPVMWHFPTEGGRLDFVSAGRQGPSYAARVTSFDWQNFYKRLGGGVFLEAAKEKLRRDYDYVLIDSRTGVSDSAGVCTVQMPENIVVVCFTLNTQGIEGAAAVARAVFEQRSRPSARTPSGLEDPALFRILPVPMRVELAEKDRLERLHEFAQNKFAGFLEHLSEEERQTYWSQVQVVYVPYYAYEEILATFGDRPGQTFTILHSMERLAAQITEGEVTSLVPCTDAERGEVMDRYALRTAPRTIDRVLQTYSEWKPLYGRVAQGLEMWLERENPKYLLNEDDVKWLRMASELLLVMLEKREFRRFWYESCETAASRQRPGESVFSLYLRILASPRGQVWALGFLLFVFYVVLFLVRPSGLSRYGYLALGGVASGVTGLWAGALVSRMVQRMKSKLPWGELGTKLAVGAVILLLALPWWLRPAGSAAMNDEILQLITRENADLRKHVEDRTEILQARTKTIELNAETARAELARIGKQLEESVADQKTLLKKLDMLAKPNRGQPGGKTQQ
jgi:hypothetical protein